MIHAHYSSAPQTFSSIPHLGTGIKCSPSLPQEDLYTHIMYVYREKIFI